MSNRINLTQFEGITKGKWQWFTGDGKKGLALFPSVEENDDILLWDESDPLAANQYTANADAIAAVPDLIAELKRCYERIDKANEAMLNAREVLMKHYDWMSMNDATSEEDDQEILDVVKDLREASE